MEELEPTMQDKIMKKDMMRPDARRNKMSKPIKSIKDVEYISELTAGAYELETHTILIRQYTEAYIMSLNDVNALRLAYELFKMAYDLIKPIFGRGLVEKMDKRLEKFENELITAISTNIRPEEERYTLLRKELGKIFDAFNFARYRAKIALPVRRNISEFDAIMGGILG